MKNAYQILGVDPTADADTIKRSYRALSRRWHPDKFRDRKPEEQKDAGLKFGEITEAYDVLNNPVKRAALDDRLAKGMVEDLVETVGRVVDAYLDSLIPHTPTNKPDTKEREPK